MAARTRSSRIPRRRNCESTILRRSAGQSGIDFPSHLYNNDVAHQITLIPGDGIGPEVADATVRAVNATGVQIEWERVDAGVKAEKETGKFLPDAVFTSLDRTRVGLKGPVATPIASGHASVNVALRKRL